MNKPVIVLSAQTKPMEAPFQQNYYYTNAFNAGAIQRAGGVPVMAPYLNREEAEALLSRADGLFLTGGCDIDPALYGEKLLPECGERNPGRDAADICLLEAALGLNKPVLCICRGFQLVNAYLGGTLYQDLPSQRPGGVRHACYEEYDRESAHTVKILPDGPLYEWLKTDCISVNSLHHQGIRTLAPGLYPSAISEDGLIEGWYRPGSPWMMGVQWHPEMLAEGERKDLIFERFLGECGKAENI